LAQANKADRIIQVAFYRPDRDHLKLLKDGKGIPFPTVVQRHFRDLEHIKNLAERAGLAIEVFKELFDGNRQSYFRELATAMGNLRNERLVVLLDPDTGIAPASHGPEHVLSEELQTVFSKLKPGDWFVLYQHRQRRRDWVEHNCKKFAQCLELPVQKVETFCSPELASDVVLFAARKV
jgi:hypothetical protein